MLFSHVAELVYKVAKGEAITTGRGVARAVSQYFAECKSLDGKTVKVGDDFVTKSGQRVKHPGLHPNCFCSCERAKGR